jgi:hypothetical protein
MHRCNNRQRLLVFIDQEYKGTDGFLLQNLLDLPGFTDDLISIDVDDLMNGTETLPSFSFL